MADLVEFRGCCAKQNSDFQEDPVVLVIGLGPAALALIRELPSGAELIVVEPKDFVEFTPGALRGFCDIEHWQGLVVSVSEALAAACPVGMQCSWIQGRVDSVRERSTLVRDNGGKQVEVHFDYAIIATGSANGIWKPEAACSSDLEAREKQLRSEQERLQAAEDSAINGEDNFGFPRVAISGGGIVGVELAAEIAEYFPGLRSHIVLLMRNVRILPDMPESASDYCAEWLERNGVEIFYGEECKKYQAWLQAASSKAKVISFLCVGPRPSLPSFDPPAALDEKGHVIVNREMRVLQAVDSSNGNDGDELWANGRVFAFGDCAEVYGLEGAFPKTIYPAEGVAPRVAYNLRMCMEGSDENVREVSPMLSPTIISLGSHDAVTVVSGHHVSSGFLASTMKYIIERSKMSEASGEVWGSLLWRFIPHV